MDFGSLIHTAQKNGQSSKKEIKYYSTKFEPPKKEQRSKNLSANIQKFLARKEEEEKKKSEEAKKRREQLLEIRSKDKKATRRVNVMLKRTKSANQSVIQDAVDEDNTAVTLAGPSQPDEDDYGYVSQSAADFYNKMMEKYSKMPEEPKFQLGKKKVSTNLNGTKDRVRAALEKEKEEAAMPHRRKRKTESTTTVSEKEYEKEEKKEEKVMKPKLKAAPIVNFNDLLKLAEKKQFEPIIVEQKKEEEERPLTKKQKRELEKEREYRERREQQHRNQTSSASPTNIKIPKLNADSKSSKLNSENKVPKMNGLNDRIPKANGSGMKQQLDEKSKLKQALTSSKNQDDKNRNNLKCDIINNKVQKQLDTSRQPKAVPEKSKVNTKSSISQNKPKQFPPGDIKSKQSNDLRSKQFPPNDLRPKQFPPNDLKSKQFPPKDIRGHPQKRKPLISKGKMYDDDDEDYDSEMDDFIDDGPEGEEDYSKYISEIFGYDKKRYRNLDDDVDDMETSFAQQMREEVISTKIGIMEDLEDMKKEEEEKRRKILMKKKRK